MVALSQCVACLILLAPPSADIQANEAQRDAEMFGGPDTAAGKADLAALEATESDAFAERLQRSNDVLRNWRLYFFAP